MKNYKEELLLVLIVLFLAVGFMVDTSDAYFYGGRRSVTVRYYDEYCRLIETEVRSGYRYGEWLTVYPKSIDGYALADKTSKWIKVGSDRRNIVKFKMRKLDEVDYTVRYIDENGDIIEEVTKKGVVGKYTQEYGKRIDGYRYVGKGDDGFIILDRDPSKNIIEFQYEKIKKEVNYTIKFVDENGKEIQDSVVEKGVVGEDISIDAPNIEGYDYIGHPDAGNLTLSGDASQNIIEFRYRKIEDPKPEYIDTITIVGKTEDGELYRVKRSGKYKVGETVSVWGLYQNNYTLADFSKKDLTISEDSNENIVVFDYYEISKSPYIGTFKIRYLDLETGEDLIKPEVGTGVKDSTMVAKAEDIDGYTVLGQGEKREIMSPYIVKEMIFIYEKD